MVRVQFCEPENIAFPVVRIVITHLHIFFFANWFNELIFINRLYINHLAEYPAEEVIVEHLINSEIGGLAANQGTHVILKLSRNVVNVGHVVSLKIRHRATASGFIWGGQLCPDILLVTCEIIDVVLLGDHLSCKC